MIAKKSGDKLLQMLSTASPDPAIMRFEVDQVKDAEDKNAPAKAKRRQY